MFEYLDVITQSHLQKISDEELYKMTTGRGEDYPRFAKWMSSPLFWSELCKDRFNIKPHDQNDLKSAKQFFQAEYLFACKRYQEAATMGSFHALEFLHKDSLSKKNYTAALQYDEALIKRYGLSGAIYCCQTYQLAVHDLDVLTYAQAAIELLNKIESSIDSPLSAHYLKELGWEAGFEGKYKNASKFIEMNRNFFETCVSKCKNICSIKP